MKIFISSLIIFGLLCTFISINAVTFQAMVDELLDAIKNLPQEPDRILTGEIIDLWFKYEDYFNLTVNHNVTDQIEVTMFNLLYAADENNYAALRQTLTVLLTDLKNSASVTLDRIL